MKPPPINLSLEHLTEAHFPRVIEMGRDLQIARLPIFRENADRGKGIVPQLWLLMKAAAEGRRTTFSIQREGECLGLITVQHDGDFREIGYFVAADQRGQGVASEALGTFIDRVKVWAKKIDTDCTLFARVDFSNAASQRVLEKNNFTLQPSSPGDDNRKRYELFIHARSTPGWI